MFKKRNVRHNIRKKPLTRFIKPVIAILMLFIGLGFVIWALSFAKPIDFLKVHIIWDIDPKLPITQTILQRQIQPLISKTYWLNLQKIKQVLQKQPWVEQAHIKRLLWNSVKITLKAKRVAMRWENADCPTETAEAACIGYISTAGVLFIPQQFINSTAALAITKPNPAVIAELYQDYQRYQALSNPMIIQSFSKTRIQQLSFEPNIKVVLGMQKQQKRLIRFLKAYKKLRKKTKKASNATFDMRYPKGFSVRY